MLSPELAQHEILSRFQWRQVREADDFIWDALGGRTRTLFNAGLGWSAGDAVKSGLFGPVIHEEIFEWIDLLQAVVLARNHFTFFELGCGYARWLVFAALALRQHNNLPATWVGVEAEPSHYKWAKKHVRDNNVSDIRLYEAAVGAADGEANFYTGSPEAWYGQMLAPDHLPQTTRKERFLRSIRRQPSKPLDTVSQVRMVGLNNLIEEHERIDLIDCDVQGAELQTFSACTAALNAKVCRVHIATHSPEIEEGLRRLFSELNWHKLNDYGCGRVNETPFGKITFVDGVQTWLNPRLADR